MPRQALRDLGECPSRSGQQLSARRGESDLPRRPVEQRVTDLAFQAADLLAQGRLRDAQALGRMAEVTFLGEHHEGVQLCEGNFRVLHTSTDIRTSILQY